MPEKPIFFHVGIKGFTVFVFSSFFVLVDLLPKRKKGKGKEMKRGKKR